MISGQLWISACRDLTHVVVGSTLASWEDGGVDSSLDVGLLVLSEENDTGSWASEGLVGGRGDNVTELEGRVLLASGDETGDVGHVAHEVGTLSVGNLSEPSVVPVSGVGGTTADDQSWLEQVGVGLELWVVDDTGGWVDSVRERLEVDRRSGDLLLGGVVTVGQVTTVWETETHDSVLGVDQSGEGGEARQS